VTLPPASIGFWVLPDVKVKPCLTAPVGSRSEASNEATHHSIRSTNSRTRHGQVGSEFNKQYSDEMKNKRHSKKHASKSKNATFPSKSINGAKSMTDVDDFENGNTKVIEESDVNVKREKGNYIDRNALGRYRRYVLESGKYMIPGLQPYYFQPSNGVSIRNLIQRRNRADILQKLARASKQEGNIPVSLHKPHRHVGFEDVNEGFPVLNSDDYDANPFPAETIYIRQIGESSDESNQDYDYTDKDDHLHEEDENVLSETKYFHGPAEYFEIFHKSGGVADEKFLGYDGELSEAESIVLSRSGQQEEEQLDDDDNEDEDIVIQEQGPTEEEDRKKKAATDSMLHKYFTETYKQGFSDEGEDFEAVRREREKHETDLKKDISNRRMPVERKSEFSDEVISKIAPHINGNPDSSIHTVKSRKAIINDHTLQDNYYDSYVPVEEAEITRSSRKVKETVKEDHDKNLPINAEEYHAKEPHTSRTRGQEKENSKKTKQNSEEDDQDSYGKSSNHDSPSVSQGTARQFKVRARKISHRVIYDNSDEDENSSDTRSNYSKQSRKNGITPKPYQRKSESNNEHVESESETAKQSQKYNVKLRLHNQETHHKTQQSHEEIDSSSHIEDDIEERVLKTYSTKRKHERAPYQFQQNVSPNKDYKVDETDATVKSQKLTTNINLDYRNKSSRRAPTGQRATQNYVLLEEKSGEDSNTYMGHSSRTEVTSNEAEERSGIDEEEEESSEVKMKPNKSRQRNHVTMRPPASNREPRYRVRRDVTPQLPVLITSVEEGQKETEVQNKDIELEAESDPTNAELQMNVQDVTENKHLETAYQNVPTEMITSLNEALQWDNKTKSNKGNNTKMKQESTENYIHLEEYEESSGYVHEDDKVLTLQINKNTQREMGDMSLDEDNYEESKGSETNSKFLTNRSMHYMGPEQSQNDGHIKQGTGTSLVFKPSNDITINSSMKADDVENDSKMADIAMHVDGVKKFHETQDDALNMKLYQEPGTAVNRLPKAIAAHMNMQHHPAKVDTEGNDSMKERFSENVRNIIVAEEKMEKPGEWKVDMPAKVVEFRHADESRLLQKEGKISKVEHKSVLVPYDLIPEFMSARSEEMTVLVPEKKSHREEVQNVGERDGLSHEETIQGSENENVKILLDAGKQRPMEGKTSSEHGEQERVPDVVEKSGNNVSVQSLANDVTPKLPPSLNSKISSDSYDATATEPSESQAQIVTKKMPFNYDTKGNIYSITDRIDTNAPNSDRAVKQNLKSINDKVINAEDEIFKITDNIRDSRSAHQSSLDGHPDSYGLAQIGNIEQKQHHVLGAEGGLKNIPYFMDGNVAVLYNDKETDNINENLEHFAIDSIADNEDVSATLVRSAKHAGHLIPILPRREKSRIHHVDNINSHARLQASALAKTGHIRAELEKKRLERFHALTAQRAKLKEDLLKLKVMAAEGKLKLPHHIVRRDTAHDENIESLISNGFLDGSSDHMKLQLSTVTKTEKIKAELEKKRLEMLHVLEAQRARLKEDLLKMKSTGREGKLKLPHHIRRRDTTQDEHVELLMLNTDSKDFQPLISNQNKDTNGYSNIDNTSVESQNAREIISDLSSHKEESKDMHFPEDTHSWLQQMLFPAAMITDQSYVQVPALDSQRYSESEVVPMKYVSVSEFVHVPKHEDKTLVDEVKMSNSGTSPFFMLHDKEPRLMYAESMFQEEDSKELKPDTENVSQENILNSSPDQKAAEDESTEVHHVEIKQLPLPSLISRPVLKNHRMRTHSKNIPISENDITFFFGLETVEKDDDEDLTKKQTYISPTLQISDSDNACSVMRLEAKDDASLNEKCGEQKSENTQALLMPVTEEIDQNHQMFLLVDPLAEEQNKMGAGWGRWKENRKKTDELKYKNKNSGGKYFNSSNKIIQSYQPLNNELHEANPSISRTLKTMKTSVEHSAVSKSNMLDDKRTHGMTLQSLTKGMDENSELMPGSGNSNAIPIRSKRALAYQFRDTFNDDLLKPSILTNKDNPKIKDDMNGRYKPQKFFMDTAVSSENKQQTGELSSNMYINVMMPGSNALSSSNVISEKNTLPDMEKFEYISDSMPTKSLYVTDVKLFSEYESKDLKPVSHKNKAENQTCLESLGNYLNDIINVEAEDGTENNKMEDAQSETSDDVNLQTNEINKRLRTSDSFVKHERNIDSGDSEKNIVDTKIIPYELHKHVRISNYKPSYSKIRKYLYPSNYKQLAASSEEFTSTEYLNPINNLGNKFNQPKEINDSSKEIFSIILDKFPNINSKSTEISEATSSNNTTITTEEIQKTATKLKDILKLPMSGNIMTNTDTEYINEPNVKKWKKESSLMPKTHPKDELKYPFRTMKNVAALEQKQSDLETVTDTAKNAGYSVIMDQNTEHGEALYGQNNSDNNREEKKQIATTGHIHKFIKNIADHVVNFFHKLSPWN
jgi:hypothetical protein